MISNVCISFQIIDNQNNGNNYWELHSTKPENALNSQKKNAT